MWSNIRSAVNDPILVVTDLFEIYRYFPILLVIVIIDEMVLQLGNTNKTPLHQTVGIITP